MNWECVLERNSDMSVTTTIFVKTAIALSVFLCACGQPATVVSPEAVQTDVVAPAGKWKLSGKPALRFEGESIRNRNVQIEVTPIVATVSPKEKASKRWGLVRLSDVDDEYEGVVFLAEWLPYYEGFTYMAHIHGQPEALLYHRKSKVETWEVRRKLGRAVKVLPSSSELVDRAEMLRVYNRQVESGLMEKLAPTTRRGQEEAQNTLLSEGLGKTLTQVCGLDGLAIDWSSVSDGWMQEYSAYEECTRTVESLEVFCKKYPNVKEGLRTIKSITCNFSSEPHEVGVVVSQNNDDILYYVNAPITNGFSRLLLSLRTEFGEMEQVLRMQTGEIIVLKYQSTGAQAYAGTDNQYFPISKIAKQNSSSSLAYIAVEGGLKRSSIAEKEDDYQWKLQCGSDNSPLERIIGPERDRILKNATFEKESKWKREPYVLARDTLGIYYYVDRYRREYGGRRYRVFVGRRGALKLSKLKGVVEDSEGTVFSTIKGDLRLIVNPKTSAIWIRGKKRTELTFVEPTRNMQLIYDELGVYFGEELGHICAL